MVAEPWIHKMRTAFFLENSSATAKKKEVSKPPQDGGGGAAADTTTVGILSFEVANAMSRAVNLYRSLSDSEIARLRSETLASHAVRLLVSTNEPYLLSLALAEKLEDLNLVAAVASRLGRRCSHPALLGFEHVYSDLLAGRIDSAGLGFLSKDMDGTVRKMERFVSSTAALYTELEVLTELEQSVKKFPPTPVHDETRRALEQKIRWQRRDVRHLRDASIWNQTYDKVVLLLAQAVCTIYSRIRHAFGESVLGLHSLVSDQSRQLSGQIIPSGHCAVHSGLLQSDASEGKSQQIPQMGAEADSGVNFRREGLRFHCGASPGRLFMECLSLGSSASWKDSDDHFENESCLSQFGTGAIIPFSGEQGPSKSDKTRRSRFGPKSRLTMLAPPSTVGGSALALHYANIVIIIEKLLRYPCLVGEEVRDDLYQMLPSSLRLALRRRLKAFVKNLAIYDAPLAHDWKEALEKILSWLAPMAHNMIQWQTERNFEQQQIVLRENVLLLQTLYFADREKTEAAICELLVGLNYICRYEQQQNALLDGTSSVDFDDRMEWHMQY
ncbi:uncharacterized protein LOC103710377 [Phoenix dactylifera]|uniref:Uncharacterized protein LOC103710377 n=1 Tax=Phoenix dactylifera TaxID=42345 RepID=A0A8B7C986_PHODC|nr:uncharacterized protein LOC103710377 [Phoenix dactylifera]